MGEKLKILMNVDDTNQAFLREANSLDLSNLRRWKNANRNFFFHKDEITEAQQLAWFNSYLTRAQDYMLIVLVNDQPIGCMGIRFLENEWDVYNVILGEIRYEKKGFMSKAFQVMLKFASSTNNNPITLKVLENNPAVIWYQKQGFEIITKIKNHYQMVFKTQNKKENLI